MPGDSEIAEAEAEVKAAEAEVKAAEAKLKPLKAKLAAFKGAAQEKTQVACQHQWKRTEREDSVPGFGTITTWTHCCNNCGRKARDGPHGRFFTS
jgi:hypothetical protein